MKNQVISRGYWVGLKTLAGIALLSGFATGCKCSEEPKKEAVKPRIEQQPAAIASVKSDPGKLKAAQQKDMKKLFEQIKRRQAGGSAKVEAKPVASVAAAPDDPLKGEFDLATAGKGLSGEGYFIATLDTDAGKLECELWHDKAPITVANFVGLARGLRPWKDNDGKWVSKPLYDGTPFHRVIKGFMIQGGDPRGNGSGGPGYVIPDEVWEDAHHDTRGLICMANRGPNTNGSQFFILDGSAPHLDGGYTIFGKCGPEEVVEKLAQAPVRGDRAIEPMKIKKVTVRREAKLPEQPKAAEASTPAQGAEPAPAPSATAE